MNQAERNAAIADMLQGLVRAFREGRANIHRIVQTNHVQPVASTEGNLEELEFSGLCQLTIVYGVKQEDADPAPTRVLSTLEEGKLRPQDHVDSPITGKDFPKAPPMPRMMTQQGEWPQGPSIEDFDR